MVCFTLISGGSAAQRIQADSLSINTVLNPKADIPWYSTWADETTSTGIGAYPSIAYSPINDLPYISYYDSVNGNLMLTHYTPDGSGNCGIDNLWYCEVVDGDGLNGHSGNDVGQYSSLDFYYNTATRVWKIGISYYDATQKVLRYAAYIYIPLMGGSWDYVTITPPLAGQEGDGKFTSIKYDQNGNPHIAYLSWRFILVGVVEFLTIASPVSSGGNCGYGDDAGKWECTEIDDGAGKYASLDIDYSDQVYIAYYDHGYHNLNYAYYIGIGGSCLNGWECTMIDGDGTDVGTFASIKAKQNSYDSIHIAYYDATNGKLKYTTSGWTSDGNCGPGNSWYCMNVDTMGTGTGMAQTGISLEIDSVGAPIIAYQNASEDLSPAKLGIARPAYVYKGTNNQGNCGGSLPGGVFSYWFCKTLDTAGYGKGYISVADHVSLALGPDGRAAIAYYEYDSYNLKTALKVAYQRPSNYLPVIIR